MKSVNVWVGLVLVAAVVLVWILVKSSSQTLAEVHLVPLNGRSGNGGQEISLADLRGKVVLLNFWGTWCPPCREEFPHIVELHHKWGSSQGVDVLAVSCGGGGNDSGDLKALREETAAFIAAKKANLPVYLDPGSRTRRAVSAAVGFSGYPTTLVIDRGGIIRGTWVGYGPGREIEMDQLIQQLVREPAT